MAPPTPEKNIGFGTGIGIAKWGGYPPPVYFSHSKKTLNFDYRKHLKIISYV